MRTRVYVDGFNLYYGAVKGTPFKWLNLVELAYQILPAGHSVDKLNYFTARVSGVSDPGAPARQHAYLSALATLPPSAGTFRELSCQNSLASAHKPARRR